MSRTKELPSETAGVQGKGLRGEPTHLNPKGGGDNSLLVKQGTGEGVYAVVLQHLSDRVKTGLFEPQCPVVGNRSHPG